MVPSSFGWLSPWPCVALTIELCIPLAVLWVFDQATLQVSFGRRAILKLCIFDSMFLWLAVSLAICHFGHKAIYCFGSLNQMTFHLLKSWDFEQEIYPNACIGRCLTRPLFICCQKSHFKLHFKCLSLSVPLHFASYKAMYFIICMSIWWQVYLYVWMDVIYGISWNIIYSYIYWLIVRPFVIHLYIYFSFVWGIWLPFALGWASVYLFG